jgi:hypothetical protein
MIDVIKLARQAGIDVLEVESERASMWPATPEGLAKFAELVQAADHGRCIAAIEALHMAQTVNNQNYPAAWHDGVDAAIDALREAEHHRLTAPQPYGQ